MNRPFIATRALLPALCLSLPTASLPAMTTSPATPSPRTERLTLLQQPVSDLPETVAAALRSPDPLVRRTAARKLKDLQPASSSLLQIALDDADAGVRRAAVGAIRHTLKEEREATLEAQLKDPSPFVRQAAVQALLQIAPRTNRIQTILQQAEQDEAALVRQTAAARHRWAFHAPARSTHDRPDMDHFLQITGTVDLGGPRWQFRPDPDQRGHDALWFSSDTPDTGWEAPQPAISRHTPATIGWYRHAFDLPDRPRLEGVDLVLTGLPQRTWIWINGRYIGQHDPGANRPAASFRTEVTDALHWSARNQITLRVTSAPSGDPARPTAIFHAAFLETLGR